MAQKTRERERLNICRRCWNCNPLAFSAAASLHLLDIKRDFLAITFGFLDYGILPAHQWTEQIELSLIACVIFI